MSRISINLLPPEFMAAELKASKFHKVQAIGIGVILFMIFLSSLTFALRILQNRTGELLQARLSKAEQRTADLKNTQASLILIKDRVKIIDQYFGIPSKHTTVYNLVDDLMPSSIIINAMTIERSGNLILLGATPDSQILDTFINSLTTNKTSLDLVKEVTIESLNRARDGLYRFTLEVTPK